MGLTAPVLSWACLAIVQLVGGAPHWCGPLFGPGAPAGPPEDAPAGRAPLRGISYAPAPLKRPGRLPNDDFWSEGARKLWGPRGRGDLSILQSLGANAVRLYGNDPELSHGAFLDHARRLGMEVIVGLSDYPYTQMPGNCRATGYDCYGQVREQYLGTLRSGLLRKDSSYHPALLRVVVVNEPDLKLGSPADFCRAVVSAVDAMLDAEVEAGAGGALPNFTAAFSFGVCARCTRGGTTRPALGQMLELRQAFLDPAAYGYRARRNVTEAYLTRFTNAFNTANPARDIGPMFLRPYQRAFPATPVFIGEYHAPSFATGGDLRQILDLSRSFPMLQGISFFEFQVRYDKPGTSERAFGMFGLGDRALDTMRVSGEEFVVWCLAPARDPRGALLHEEVAAAYGGPGVDASRLCPSDPGGARPGGAVAGDVGPERRGAALAGLLA